MRIKITVFFAIIVCNVALGDDAQDAGAWRIVAHYGHDDEKRPACGPGYVRCNSSAKSGKRVTIR